MKRGYDDTEHQKKIIYEWKIKKISSHINNLNKNELRSSKFSSGDDIGNEWCLILKLNNDESSTYQEWLSLFIHNSLSRKEGVIADYVLYVRWNYKSKEIISIDNGFWAEETNAYGKFEFLNKKRLIIDKDSLLPEDILTVGVELTVHDSIPPSSTPKNKTEHRFNAKYKELYETKEDSDCVIKVKDRSFKAHKFVLKTSSPVFSAMFINNLIEKQTNEVSIPDIRPEVFDKFLEYCYTDEVTSLRDVNRELLAVADKYQLDMLKKICGKSLAEEVEVNNAAELLILAEHYNVKELVECIVDFILDHIAEVMESPDFQVIKEEKPFLSSMLFKRLVEINLNNPAKIIHYS